MSPDVLPESALSLADMVLNSGMVAKAVLVILFLFSAISWSIILNKFFVYRSAKNEDSRFLDLFSQSDSLNNIYNFSRELHHSPVARVFLKGYKGLYRVQERSKTVSKSDKKNPENFAIEAKDLREINLHLDKAVNAEIERLSRRLEFLATTGSASPFIGLFGTVWGIMHSFRAIGVKGSASIGGVAPGIAEALIATAAGLVAAIPAVIFYNYLNNKIRWFTIRMDDFSRDFIFMAENNFRR
jgi:biopolymer transport protein TolQ